MSNKGTLTPWATGLTNVTSLAFGNDGHLYGIELTTEGLLTQSAGALVKITPQGTQVVADGLMQPYGVAIRGGFAYVTTGTVAGAGGGSVVKIQL